MIDYSKMVTAEDKFEQAKDTKRREITSACQAAIDGGFSFSGHVFDSDPRSQTNIIGTANAVQAGISLPDGFTWRTQANENVPMDDQGIIALGAALLEHVNACYARSWQLKAIVDSADSISDLDAINWVNTAA